MTVAAVEHAVALCQRHPRAHFVGPRPELVASAESALGVALPPSYRRFVERLGAGNIGSFEVYGLIGEPFDGPIPDAVWATLDSRRGPSQLRPSMVVIGEDGMGGEYVLDTAKGPEPPVEVWYGGASPSGDVLERVAEGFGAYLLDGVRRVIDPDLPISRPAVLCAPPHRQAAPGPGNRCASRSPIGRFRPPLLVPACAWS